MPANFSRRDLLRAGCFAGLAAAPGCGTIMYPERRGQPAGDIDWKIVALDGIGLLLFFVPGVVAFAVDFSTGAIYLPPGVMTFPADDLPAEMVTEPTPVGAADRSTPFHVVETSRDWLTRDRIEQVVSAHVGRSIRLDERCQTAPLRDLDEFWPRVKAIAGEGLG